MGVSYQKDLEGKKGLSFELVNVTKTFYPLIPWHRHRAITAVRSLSLKVRRGEIFTLLGPNGAGKTTTIKMIAGLILPTSGEIVFFGKDGFRLSRRQRIGALLEGTRNIYWRLSPLENLYYFGELKGLPLTQIKRDSRRLLEELDLLDRARASVQTLSRGMQQKVALAVALLGDPELLLLDEPTLGLDVESSIHIKNKLRSLARDQGKTIVLTTHNMELAASVADRVGIIQNGNLIAEDSLQNLVQYFQKADFEIELPKSDWIRVQPLMKDFKYTLRSLYDEGFVSVTFHLADTSKFFSLVGPLERAGVNFRLLRQVSPTLEDVFLEITSENRSDKISPTRQKDSFDSSPAGEHPADDAPNSSNSDYGGGLRR